MSIYAAAIIAIVLFVVELLYFRIADRYNIIDKPNHRSSHSLITIRGGGIIFSLSLLLSPIYLGLNYVFFLIGLFLISVISFVDDIKTIGSAIRIGFHLAAVALLFFQLGIYSLPIYVLLLAFFIAIGTINAMNFMDGINGITGAYGLITLATFAYINKLVISFTSADCLLVSIISVLVFNFFNFRKKAKCFAGDVGSVSLSFIIIFFLIQLILKTSNVEYILLLLIYGLDTAITICFRIIRGEKISEAHRSHFYQYLANEKKMPHLFIASGYAVTQLIINVFVIKYNHFPVFYTVIFTLALGLLFIALRFFLEGWATLLGKK